MLKRLLKCIKGLWLPTILAPILVLAEVRLNTLIPYTMATLIDEGIEVGNMEVIKSTGMVLIGYALLSMLCGAASGIAAAYAGSGFSRNLRHDLFYTIQKFSFSNVDKFSSAGLVTRMTTDVTRMQMVFNQLIRVAFRSPASMIFALIMAFKVSKTLPWVFIVVLPFLGFGLGFVMRKAHPYFKKRAAKVDDVNMNVQENVRGIRVVKSFVTEEFEKKKFGKTVDELKDYTVKAERIVNLNGPIMNTAMYFCSLMISWLGAKMCVVGTLTTGQLMSLISYIMQILTSLMMFEMIFLQLTQARVSAERIFEVLTEVPDIQNGEDPVYEVKDGSISFENVSFAYGKGGNCLSDIDNIEIKSGETIGILGGTGTGKTSLVMLIPRLYDVKTGSIKVGGVDVRDYDVTTLRKAVSMVLQKNVLFSGTIRENLSWGKQDATEEEMWEALRLAQADKFVSQLPDGIDTEMTQGGSNVSGGQRQRLCIARALISKPKVLILDDSTSALDTATEARIREGFREFIPGTTKIIIAQRISSVKDADRIIVLEEGKVNGIGTHEELLATNKIYQEVYDSQTKGGDFDEPQAD